MTPITFLLRQPRLAIVVLATVLSACGGGADPTGSTYVPPDPATGQVVFAGAVAPQLAPADLVMEPAFQVAAALSAPPDAIDADGRSGSAKQSPQSLQIAGNPSPVEGVLTAPRQTPSDTPAFHEFAATATRTITTYRPAQIRAAYGLPAVPVDPSGLTSAQKAQLGAGQTVFIIAAKHNAFVASELQAFNQLFGLPGCTKRTLPASDALVLPAPSATSCDFYQLYSTTAGGMTSTEPSYDPRWAVEIAMDVQWAHATAPLSRIVLIEASDASVASMSGAIQLANALGPGVVSMSFGGSEGVYVNAANSLFQTPGMTYFAATGDNGMAVNWPAVSPYVVAVGGTTLNFSGSGNRTETVWSGTGGGISRFVPLPDYQNNRVMGFGTLAGLTGRSAADVAFNADPNTGQYTAIIPNQATCTFCQVSYTSVGGTSLATPQWAGITAVANAMRALAGKTPIGDIHPLIYSQIGAAATSYSNNFLDVTSGSHGTCRFCFSQRGYDAPSGLGTPQIGTLVTTFSGVPNVAMPPVVNGAGVTGMTGQNLTFTVSVTQSNPVAFTLADAPGGMTISAAGVITWPSPRVGSYPITVLARDTRTGLTGQGIININIYAPPTPSVSSGNIAVTVGQVLNYTVAVGYFKPCTLTLSGAPAGMTISNSGMLSWARPVAGSYSVSVTATDPTARVSGTGVFTLAVSPPGAPVVSSGNVSAKPGVAMTFDASATGVNPITLSLSGAPAGMSIAPNGSVSWNNPLAGSYTVTVNALDSVTRITGRGVYSVKVGDRVGPAINGSGLNGLAGQALKGYILITDPNSPVVGAGVGAAPLGMSLDMSAGPSKIAVNWPNPVAGTYNLQVSASDGAGVSSASAVTVTIKNR